LVVVGKREPFYFLELFEKDNYLYLKRERETKISLPIKIKEELPENLAILELEDLTSRRYFPISLDEKEKFIIINPLILE